MKIGEAITILIRMLGKGEAATKIEGIRSASGKTLVPVTMKFKIVKLEPPEVEEIKGLYREFPGITLFL